MSTSDAKQLQQALDLMGTALATHGHQWTEEERFSYELATKITSSYCRETD